jgi:hypothetical protein
MGDLPLACLITSAMLFLIVFVGSEFVAAHTGTPLPKFLGGRQVPRRGRKSLIIEIPWIGGILGIGQLVVLALLLHPASTTPVRLVAAAEVAGVAVWLWYEWQLVFRRS